MGWFDILKKRKKGDWHSEMWSDIHRGRFQGRGPDTMERFTETLDDRLKNREKHQNKNPAEFEQWDKKQGIKNLHLLTDMAQIDNPQYIINEAMKFYPKINLKNRYYLRIFLADMKKLGWDMKEFENIKGLLTETSEGIVQDPYSYDKEDDLSGRIKQTVRVFKRMNIPISKESILEEFEMDESVWKDEYDELLR